MDKRLLEVAAAHFPVQTSSLADVEAAATMLASLARSGQIPVAIEYSCPAKTPGLDIPMVRVFGPNLDEHNNHETFWYIHSSQDNQGAYGVKRWGRHLQTSPDDPFSETEQDLRMTVPQLLTDIHSTVRGVMTVDQRERFAELVAAQRTTGVQVADQVKLAP